MKPTIKSVFSNKAINTVILQIIGLIWGANLYAQTAPIITTEPVSEAAVLGSNANFSVLVTGTGPFSYQWLFNGAPIITTVAGNGIYSYAGDGGSATKASLFIPLSVALDTSENLYIADTSNNRIRMVNTNGIITTIAGNGMEIYAGDGGPATNACVNNPGGVALDTFGNLYIADTDNRRIRKINTNGIITTVAGNGLYGYAGDGGAATNARLNEPAGVALDASGDLYIADAYNNRIRMVNTNGTITTVAGNGNSDYTGDGGAATNASLNHPASVAIDTLGNLYIADTENGQIRVVNTNNVITSIPEVNNSEYSWPEGVACDTIGNLYIADTDNGIVYKMATNGVATVVAGNGHPDVYNDDGDGGAATNASLTPFGVAFDTFGNLFIADTENNRIRMVGSKYPTLSLENIGIANSGNYSVVITSPYGSVTSAVVSLTVLLPPTINAFSGNQFVTVADTATLFVGVAGTVPFNYSWYFDGTVLIQNGTNNTFTLPDAAISNSGDYTVVITNNYGSITSQVATLTVDLPPTVTRQPVNQTNIYGTTASFTVDAGNVGPFTYQWMFNGTNLPNSISTIAGNYESGFGGDGGVATKATLAGPTAIACNGSEDIYIADTINNRVRMITPNGIITTVAGTNNHMNYTGDGGKATNASLDRPADVACDGFGNLYIADTGNNRIRMVNTNGIITTVAGGCIDCWYGNGVVATNTALNTPAAITLDAFGNLYIADTGNNRICMVNTNGTMATIAGNGLPDPTGDGGAATNAGLYFPAGIAFDTFRDLYIADTGNNRIRMVDTNGIITTVAGDGSTTYNGDDGAAINAGLPAPRKIAFDAFNNLYIASDGIRIVDTNGSIETVVGDGPGNLYNPQGINVDPEGNLYIADTGYNRVLKVLRCFEYPTLTLTNIGADNAGNYSVRITSPYGSVISAVAALTVLLPPAVNVLPTNQFVAVGGTATFSVDPTGTPPFNYAWYFNETGLNATDNTFVLPNVTINNSGVYTVVVTNNYGSVTSEVSTLTVSWPPTVAEQPVNQTNTAGTTANFSVSAGNTGPFTYQWYLNGTNLPDGVITVASWAPPSWPFGITFDTVGNLYISDIGNYKVRKIDSNEIITTVAGNGSTDYAGNGVAATNSGLAGPFAIAFDSFGNLYITDTGYNQIVRVNTNGTIATVTGNGSTGYSGDGGVATNAELTTPEGITFDSFGNLYIADSGSNRIRMVNTNGIISTVAGNGSTNYNGDVATNAGLSFPTGITCDGAGNVYIADTGNNRIRMVSTNGIITTVAGNGGKNYTADGGAATNVSLNAPMGVAFDAFGNLYIADTGNNRICMVNTSGTITTTPTDGNEIYDSNLSGPVGIALDKAGNLYVTDTGYRRIREVLLYSGYPTLVLKNIGAENAGNYSVVITSPYGGITSAVASLTVTIPTTAPQISTSGLTFGLQNNQFGFNVGAMAGQTIIVEGSTNLVNWTPLFTNTPNGTPFYFYDPQWTNLPSRFYRARQE